MWRAATGIVTTLAGNGNYASNGDGGPAADAALAYPTGVAAAASTGDVRQPVDLSTQDLSLRNQDDNTSL